MRRARKALRRARRDERGFTLIELIVAMPLMLVLLFTLLNFMDLGAKSQMRTTDRAQAITQAKVGLDRMARETREAASFKLLTSQVVEIVTPVRPASGASSYSGNLRLVRYDCSGGRCVRYEGPKGGPLGDSGTVLFTDVRNVDIFSPTPNFVDPTYIAIALRISIRGFTNTINLMDGVNLRNRRFGG